MLKGIKILGLSALLSIQLFAANSNINIANKNGYVNYLMENEKAAGYDDSRVLFAIEEKWGHDLFQVVDAVFIPKTNTIEVTRVIKERTISDELGKGKTYKNVNDFGLQPIAQKSIAKLTQSINYEKCRDLKSFGDTNFKETFIGTQGNDFTITYSISQSKCKDLTRNVDKEINTLKKKVKSNEQIVGTFIIPR